MRSTPAASEIARAIAIGAALIATVAVGIEVASYESARAVWSAERARLGSAQYDAARSDAAYVEVEARRGHTRRASEIAAVAIVIAASLAGGTGDARRGTSSRLLLASVADVLVLGVLIAIAIVVPGSIASLAIADALARILPAIALALPIALLARGASPGMRVARLAIDPPRPLRAVLTIVLLPIVAPWIVLAALPLAIVARRRDVRVSLVAPHLALAGITRR
ncbi:hypothetical protein [Sandaracinus amylolyticus]|uniref:hypothetical protein n=1 Tax=Sandaracinus amylolyticus TaxID=927083 RepID=UPI001F2C6FFA|nr:hypothetical protein [Sandaracinus amylolyticus]UJR78832.1 Hypothetical protein I5071_8650 [Sandaracinus amylolyticus]